MNVGTRIAAAAALLAFAAAAPAAALGDTPEAYEKKGDTITAKQIRHDLFNDAKGALTMKVTKGKGVCVKQAGGSIKAKKVGDCTLKFMLMPTGGAMQTITVLLHVTKSGKSPGGG